MRGHLTHRYVIALGSNMRVPGVGGPRQVVEAACTTLSEAGLGVERVSPIVTSVPLGPSRRRYANAAVVVESLLDPPAVLAQLQRIERQSGRRRRGQRWRARPLDLDIVLWSGGTWRSTQLTIPHPAFRARAFVLAPAAAIAANWRDPVTGRTLAQLAARLDRPRPAA